MTSSDKAADAIKSITPEQLEKTRAEVHAEVENSKIVEAVDAEGEDEDDEDDEDETEESVEGERLAKIDMISDIQLILIDKYRSGLKLLMVCMLLSLAVFAAQVLQFFRTMSLHGSVIVLQEDQRKVLAQQEDMAKSAAENKKDVEQVRIAVKRTEDKVEEAVESSPKIEIDDKGKVTKVIVPVKKAGSKKKKDPKDEPEPKPKPELPPPPKPVQQNPPPPPAPVEFSEQP
jgi:hypothetical protein